MPDKIDAKQQAWDMLPPILLSSLGVGAAIPTLSALMNPPPWGRKKLPQSSIWNPPAVRVDPQIEKEQPQSLEPVEEKDKQDETDPVSLFQSVDHQKAGKANEDPGGFWENLKHFVPDMGGSGDDNGGFIENLKYFVPESVRGSGKALGAFSNEWDSLTDPVGMLKGDYSHTFMDVPWFGPAVFLGGGALGALGYGGAQHLTKQLDVASSKTRLRDARKEYEKALAEERERSKVGQQIDKIFDELHEDAQEKEASLQSAIVSTGLTASALAVLQALLDSSSEDKPRLSSKSWERAQQALGRQRLKENLPIYALSSEKEEPETNLPNSGLRGQLMKVPGSHI